MKFHALAPATQLLLAAAMMLALLAGCSSTSPDANADDRPDQPLANGDGRPVRVGVTAPPDGPKGNPPIRTVDSVELEMREFLLGTNIEQDQLKGLGVVYGLAGTGTVPRDLVHANQLREQLKQLQEGGLVPDLVTFEDFERGACALVTVTARYPTQRTAGSRFDITITNDGGAVSLKHGGMFPVHLRDASRPEDDTTWALTDQDISRREPIWTEDEQKLLRERAADPDAKNLPEPEPLSWRVKNAGYLVRDLPPDRNSNQTLVLALGEYNRDIYDAMRQAIRQRYPFEISQASGGLGRGRVKINMTPGFSMTAEQVLDDLGAMHFMVQNTRVPLVLFDNRSGEIVIVNGAIRLKRRWLATAHVPDPASEHYEAARHRGVPGNPALPVFSWGNITDTSGAGMAPVPYIVAAPDENYEDIKRVMEDKGANADERRGGLIGEASGLKLITWRGDPGQNPEEVRINLPRNDLREILRVLRDDLHLPGPELKQFVLEAHRRGYLSDCFVMERFPRMVHSEARDMTWFPATQQVAIGNVVLRGHVIAGDEPGTWDFLPGPVAPDAPSARGFTVEDANRIGNLVKTLDGNRFRWRDEHGELQVRQIRLSERTRESLHRARIQLLIDGCDPTRDGVEQALDRLQIEMRNLAGVRTEPGETPREVAADELEPAAARVFGEAVAWLKRLQELAAPTLDWKQAWPGRPSPANAIRQ